MSTSFLGVVTGETFVGHAPGRLAVCSAGRPITSLYIVALSLNKIKA